MMMLLVFNTTAQSYCQLSTPMLTVANYKEKMSRKLYMTLQMQETLVIGLVHLAASEMTNTE